MTDPESLVFTDVLGLGIDEVAEEAINGRVDETTGDVGETEILSVPTSTVK